MSFNRRNWSDLSSLARQRTLEDEEEQQRERRRRHRSLLSSTSTDEDPPSPSKEVNLAPSRPQTQVKAVSPEEAEEHKLLGVLKTQEGRRTRPPVAIPEKPREKKEQQEPGTGVSSAGLQQPGGQENVLVGKLGQDAAKAREEPSGDQHPEPVSERKVITRGRLQDKEGQATGTQQRDQRSEVGKQQLQTVQEQRSRPCEVKTLTGGGNRSTEEKTVSVVTLSPGEQHPPRSIPKEATQRIPTQDEPAEKSEASSARVTYSSSIRRSSPRTVSFRVISRKEREENQSPLTRSVSLRIPGNSTTIEEKLEKYNSAVQRSELAKSSLTVQKNLTLSSEGVASKRNFFEMTAPTKAEPLAVRKDNLKIQGSVTSRIDLWISRAQEPSKEEKSKDIRRVNSLIKRDVWVKQPRDSSGDTKL
ncbi:PREDICTED: ladinin-1 [Tinamus guttatus]|uniref:ladinin-1 n=1 Tax=Tinamus guttatus TaxID=94827 RepID=UPI00052E6DD2|nr:PREDICTED: ladinin-1 [Tinamus guttatus]